MKTRWTHDEQTTWTCFHEFRFNCSQHPKIRSCLFLRRAALAVELTKLRLCWRLRLCQAHCCHDYTPVDPKQSFHIHCSVCVHVCCYTSSWCWQFEVHLNWEQHESQVTSNRFFMLLLSGVYLVQLLKQQEDTKGERTDIRTNHKWNRDETRTGHRH